MAFLILFLTGLILPVTFKQNVLVPKGLTLAAFAAAIYFIIQGYGIPMKYFVLDEYAQLLEVVTLIVFAATALTLSNYNRSLLSQMLFIAAASLAILEVNNLVIFIVLFEVIAIISYAFAANIKRPENAEGAIKMFIAGATASGIILLGLALYSLVTPSFDFDKMNVQGNFALIAVAIMFAGIFYKLTIAPMHAWAGDSYAQLNHATAAVLSGAVKTVVAVAVFKAFYKFMISYETVTVYLFSFFAILTMTIGNFMALFQKRIASILAYSSVAHAGYMLIPFAAVASAYAPTGLMYLGIAYVFMQTSVFLILNDLRRDANITLLDHIKGLGQRSPMHAFFFAIQLLSLAGIPPLAGFISKVVAFYAAVDAGLWPLALIAALNSALSVAFYAWIIKHMYFDKPVVGVPRMSMTPGSFIGQLILLAGTIYFGIDASLVFNVKF